MTNIISRKFENLMITCNQTAATPCIDHWKCLYMLWFTFEFFLQSPNETKPIHKRRYSTGTKFNVLVGETFRCCIRYFILKFSQLIKAAADVAVAILINAFSLWLYFACIYQSTDMFNISIGTNLLFFLLGHHYLLYIDSVGLLLDIYHCRWNSTTITFFFDHF